jgi:hypothetical protein
MIIPSATTPRSKLWPELTEAAITLLWVVTDYFGFSRIYQSIGLKCKTLPYLYVRSQQLLLAEVELTESLYSLNPLLLTI